MPRKGAVLGCKPGQAVLVTARGGVHLCRGQGLLVISQSARGGGCLQPASPPGRTLGPTAQSSPGRSLIRWVWPPHPKGQTYS